MASNSGGEATRSRSETKNSHASDITSRLVVRKIVDRIKEQFKRLVHTRREKTQSINEPVGYSMKPEPKKTQVPQVYDISKGIIYAFPKSYMKEKALLSQREQREMSENLGNSIGGGDAQFYSFRGVAAKTVETLVKGNTRLASIEGILKHNQQHKGKLMEDAKNDLSYRFKSVIKKNRSDQALLSKMSQKSIPISAQDTMIAKMNLRNDILETKKLPDDDLILPVGFRWVTTNPDTWIPGAREEATMTALPNGIILYGGYGIRPMDDTFFFEFGSEKWLKIEGENENWLVQGRYGHSTLVYKKDTLICFGGETTTQKDFKSKVCLNGVHIFSMESKSWNSFNCQGDTIPGRKNHVALMLGKTMLVYGGISQRGTFLDDIWYLDLQTKSWINLLNTISGSRDVMSGGVAFHAGCAVFSARTKFKTLFSAEEHPLVFKSKNPLTNTVEQEWAVDQGCYFFGGLNEKGDCIGDLKLLKIGKGFPLKWIPLTTKGTQPSPRYQHSMVFFESILHLVIYGGRNDKCQENRGRGPGFLDDIHALNLLTLSWSTVSVDEMVSSVPRACHSATYHDNRMYVLGGITENGLARPGMMVLEVEDSPFSAGKFVRQATMKPTEKTGERVADEKSSGFPSPLLKPSPAPSPLKARSSTMMVGGPKAFFDEPFELPSPESRKDDDIFGHNELLESLNFKNFVSHMSPPKRKELKHLTPMKSTILPSIRRLITTEIEENNMSNEQSRPPSKRG